MMRILFEALTARPWLPIVVIGLISGCGGGGGGGSQSAQQPPPPPPTYDITTSVGTGGSISPTSQTVQSGNIASFTISADTGFTIENVSGCNGSLSGSTYTTGSITSNCTITVSFSRLVYSVSTADPDNGSISPNSADVLHGDTAEFTVTPDTGYEIEGVSGCDGSLDGETYTTGTITSECVVTATFTPIIYTLQATAGANGQISPESVEAEHGSSVTFTVIPDTGYLVDEITGCDGTLADDEYVVDPVIEACEVTAEFRLPYITGQLFAMASTAADMTVNDPNAPFEPNNTIATAQPIPNPVTIGGYANVPGAGEDGRSHEDGDEFDVYRVALLGGQLAILQIASEELNENDLDLYLVDEDANIIEASLGIGAQFEWVMVPPGENGIYYLVVHAFSGASNYTLTVGSSVASIQQQSLRLSDEFVPGDAIIRFSQTASGRAAQLREDAILQYGLTVRAMETEERNMRYRMAREHGLASMNQYSQRTGVLAELGFRDAVTEQKFNTLYAIKMLSLKDGVEAVSPNYLYDLHGTVIPNDQFYGHQWHYPQIGLEEAWALSTGQDVVVAVIDSGVAIGHPDLQGQFVPGFDFVLGIPGGNDPGISPIPPGGNSYHGTHVAGTIAAVTDNNMGVAGVAHDSRIMPLRACVRMCDLYAIEQSLRYASGLPNDSGEVPAQPADVINMSLGRIGSPIPSEEELLNVISALGIIVVASAGNQGSDTPSFPAAYDAVIAVGAVDMRLERARYSNFGHWIDVVAPGGDMSQDINADGHGDGVLSTVVDDRGGVPVYSYNFNQGTSMAAPHVSGVIALMRAVAPDLGPWDVQILLANGAITDNLGEPGHDPIYGHGQINAYKAVIEAINFDGGNVLASPFLVASPNTLNFGASLTQAKITLMNAGGGNLELDQPLENSGGWLFGSSAVEDGNTVWTIEVVRDELPEGAYQATITFPSNANTVQVRVYMQVASEIGPHVGFQYVILVDIETLDTVNGAIAMFDGIGSYEYMIEDVEPGAYVMLSGSDFNNDGFICDRGESCGIYRSFGDLVILDVDGADLEGADFIVGYRSGLLTQAFGNDLEKLRRFVPEESDEYIRNRDVEIPERHQLLSR